MPLLEVDGLHARYEYAPILQGVSFSADAGEIVSMFGRNGAGKTLSGGEQQMLAIGRALVGSPKLLLVDEPSEGLAPMVVTEIFESLSRMRDAGIALLLVEQNVRRASAISSSCCVIEKGRVI